jgi:glycosyltransferase involved in cell wall biosynthesis
MTESLGDSRSLATELPHRSGHSQDYVSDAEVELSVVMPCLNEADTIATCIRKARRGLAEAGMVGEIIVADNGSTDGSQEIAHSLGARVVSVAEPGYGAALMGGIAAARGRYVIMGDADDSYDFGEIPKFVDKLREGYDLVQGCRLPAGGGTVLPGAMPFLHRWWGNPMFTMLVRRWFGAPVHDVYCGLRGFRKGYYESLGQRCTGMEFATEMIIRSSLRPSRITEVPIKLHPDGRVAHAPHLKTFRDGWRTLRFFLFYSPRWLFLFPGALLVVAGLAVMAWLLPAPRRIGAVTFDYNTLLFAAGAVMLGAQSVLFWIFAKVFAISEGLLNPDRRITKLLDLVTLEVGASLGAGLFLAGLGIAVYALSDWSSHSFGNLSPSESLRLVIPAVLCMVLGLQGLLGSFFIGILRLRQL